MPDPDRQVVPTPDGGTQDGAGSAALAVVDGPIDAVAQDDGALYFSVEDPTVDGVSWLGSVAKDGSSPAVKLATLDSPFATGIALDATWVYWTSLAGTVWRVPKQGGTPEQLASSQARPSGIAVMGETVYWANQGSDDKSVLGSIVGLDTTTRALTTIVAGLTDAPTWLVADADALYWADDVFADVPPAIHRVARAGGTPGELASGAGDVGPIALAGNEIFWASWSGSELRSVPVSGGSPTVWATDIGGYGPNSTVAPAPDGRGVYWADTSTGAASFVEAPGDAPRALTPPVPALDQPLTNQALFVLVDATRVYLVQYQGSYTQGQRSLILPIQR